MNRRTVCMIALALGMFVPSFAFAQDRQDGDRGGRGDFDPARFMEERMNRTKERLGATEEEWQVIKPKLEKVMTAQAEAVMGRFGMGGGRRGGDGGGNRDANRGG